MDPPSCLQLYRLISDKRFIFLRRWSQNKTTFNSIWVAISTSGEGNLIELDWRLSSDQKTVIIRFLKIFRNNLNLKFLSFFYLFDKKYQRFFYFLFCVDKSDRLNEKSWTFKKIDSREADLTAIRYLIYFNVTSIIPII